MESILKLFENDDFSGELDFLLVDTPIYDDGNIGIPMSLLKSAFREATMEFKVGNRLKASLLLVIISPDHYTAWNYRKSQLKDGNLNPEREIILTKFLLTKHQAKPLVWHHLYWIYSNFGLNLLEMHSICDTLADKYRCNYPAWKWRRVIVSSCLGNYAQVQFFNQVS
jgi:hypothetical protein